MDLLTVETFLNECHWPWAVEGLREAQVKVQRACGHPEVLTLPYSTDVERLMELARKRCAGCQAGVEERFQKTIREAEARAKALELPELVGLSPRQVGFAMAVRDKALLRFGEAGDVQRCLRSVRDAEWWIDNRGRAKHLKVFSEMARALESGQPVG